MYARVTALSYQPDQVPDDAIMQQFIQLRAQQPGYRGMVTIDLGHGRRLNIILHDTEDQSVAAVPTTNPALRPLMEQHLQPRMAAPPRTVGAGPVLFTDLSTA